MKKRFLRSPAALRSRPLRRRKPSPIWLRHPGMARLRQPPTTSVLTTRNRTTPYQHQRGRTGKPDPINHPTPVPVLKCMRRHRPNRLRTPCPSPRHPNRVQKPSRLLETRRSILTRRSKLGSRMLLQSDRLRSRAQRKVLTRRLPRPPGWKPRLRQRLLPRRRSPPTSPAAAVRESTIMGVLEGLAPSRPRLPRRPRPLRLHTPPTLCWPSLLM